MTGKKPSLIEALLVPRAGLVICVIIVEATLASRKAAECLVSSQTKRSKGYSFNQRHSHIHTLSQHVVKNNPLQSYSFISRILVDTLRAKYREEFTHMDALHAFKNGLVVMIELLFYRVTG